MTNLDSILKSKDVTLPTKVHILKAMVFPKLWCKCEKRKSESHSVMLDSLWPHGLYSSWNSPGQNTGVGSLSPLQGSSKPRGQTHVSYISCIGRQILYQLSHKGSPRILEWVAYPFSSVSSRPRDWTRVSCIAGGFFTNWAIREVLNSIYLAWALWPHLI